VGPAPSLAARISFLVPIRLPRNLTLDKLRVDRQVSFFQEPAVVTRSELSPDGLFNPGHPPHNDRMRLAPRVRFFFRVSVFRPWNLFVPPAGQREAGILQEPSLIFFPEELFRLSRFP